MPKFKPARLPRCPNIADIRADFRELSKKLWAARQEYITKCFEASLSLRGKALAGFIKRVAVTMQANGLYSQTPPVGEIAWTIARWFGRIEVGSDYWRRQRWWADRGLTQEIVSEMRNRCGRGRRRLVA